MRNMLCNMVMAGVMLASFNVKTGLKHEFHQKADAHEQIDVVKSLIF